MTFTRARILVCAMLAMPAVAAAQSSRSQTIFAPSRVGSVTIRAAVVLADFDVKPLPLMTVVARRNDRADSVSGRTDLDGRLSMSLPAGSYTIIARAPQPVEGRAFAWSVPLVIRASTRSTIELTNDNASTEGAAAVAAAPKPGSASPATAAPDAAVAERARTAQTAQSAQGQHAGAAAPAPAPRVAAPAPAPVSRPVAQRRLAESTPLRANTSKLFLGLALNGSSISADDLSSSTESGGGLAAQLGWGFTKHFALFLDVSGAQIATDGGDFTLGHADAGARWHFVSQSRALVPFLEAAFSGRAAVEQDVVLFDGSGNPQQGDLSISGAGFSLGGGLQYFVAPTWALGGSLKWTTGEFSRVQFDKVSVDGFELDATTARFNLGFTWYPMMGSRR